MNTENLRSNCCGAKMNALNNTDPNEGICSECSEHCIASDEVEPCSNCGKNIGKKESYINDGLCYGLCSSCYEFERMDITHSGF